VIPRRWSCRGSALMILHSTSPLAIEGTLGTHRCGDADSIGTHTDLTDGDVLNVKDFLHLLFVEVDVVFVGAALASSTS
jgi:hypothetical protein